MTQNAKPAKLQAIQGNPNRRTKKELHERIKKEEKMTPDNDKVVAPDWLTDEATEHFNFLADQLLSVDLISNLDVDLLAIYCRTWEEYIECDKIVREEGLMVEYTNKAAETNKVPHPLLTKKKHLFDKMKSIAVEMGLTINSRAKLAIPRKEEKKEDPFTQKFGEI